jgi:membrane associated rhomboid family serine protease
MNGEDTTYFYSQIWNKLILPPTFKQLLYQPWSLITYMFVEMSFWSIVGNMIWLWIFGLVIEDLKGIYQILPIYLMGGILGGLAMITINTFFATTPYYFSGAIASMISVAVAALLYKPSYTYWFFNSLKVPIWVLFIIFIFLNVLALGKLRLPVALLLIGGTLAGVLYNYGLTTFYAWCTYYFSKFGSYVVNNENFVVKKKRNLSLTSNNLPYKTVKVESEKIDQLLDKINLKGINSLSDNEKKILEEYSKK